MSDPVYNGDAPHAKRSNTMPAIFTFRLDPELKRALGERADAEGLPLNEYMALVLAKHIKRPELAKIPRKSIGRPRNDEAPVPAA